MVRGPGPFTSNFLRVHVRFKRKTNPNTYILIIISYSRDANLDKFQSGTAIIFFRDT